MPELKGKKKIRILEPSVGIGNFIPLLIEKYKDKDEVIFDLVDIDNNCFVVLKNILDKLKLSKKFNKKKRSKKENNKVVYNCLTF